MDGTVDVICRECGHPMKADEPQSGRWFCPNCGTCWDNSPANFGPRYIIRDQWYPPPTWQQGLGELMQRPLGEKL